MLGYRYGSQPLQDTAPGTFESLVGSLLGSYQAMAEEKRRKKLEDQDRATAVADRQRLIDRQDAADADSRAATDLGMLHEGFTRGPAGKVPSVNVNLGMGAPDIAVPTVQNFGQTVGGFSKTLNSDAERSAVRDAAEAVTKAEVAKQQRIRVGQLLGGTPGAVYQEDPVLGGKLFEEQQKPRNIDPNAPSTILAKEESEKRIKAFEKRLHPTEHAPIVLNSTDANGKPISRLVDWHGREIGTAQGTKGGAGGGHGSLMSQRALGVLPSATAAFSQYQKDLAASSPEDKAKAGQVVAAMNDADIQQFSALMDDPAKMMDKFTHFLGTRGLSDRSRRIATAAFQVVRDHNIALSGRGGGSAAAIMQDVKAALYMPEQVEAHFKGIRALAGQNEPSDAPDVAPVDVDAAADAWLATRRRKKP